jgi:hypothetical protein
MEFCVTTASKSENVIFWGLPSRSSFRGARKREPGIHNHDGEYGFRACAKRRIYDVQLHIGK